MSAQLISTKRNIKLLLKPKTSKSRVTWPDECDLYTPDINFLYLVCSEERSGTMELEQELVCGGEREAKVEGMFFCYSLSYKHSYTKFEHSFKSFAL